MAETTRPFPQTRPRAKPRPRTRAKPRSKWQRFLLRYGWLLPVGAILVGGGILMLTYAFARIPLPPDIPLTSSAQVFDRNGKLIGTYSDEITRFIIDTSELPEFIGQAVVAAEDKEFYDHNGVSLRGIARAAWANVTGGEIQQGGSTITQQYVKNAVLKDPSRTVTRKVKEAILAIKLERRFSKDEILGFYLNTVYFGRGAYGVEAAARTYFGHAHATELSLGEAAYLASIIPSPETYQPDENQRGARQQRDRVLQVMVDEGYISRQEARAASTRRNRRVRLDDQAERQVKPQKAAYFLEWLRKEYLEPEFGSELFTEGLEIHTTLDMKMQEQAEQAIREMLPNEEDPQAALVSMTPNGEVRALVGGRDFTNVKKARGFNYASDPPGRQAGSAFKPFTLLTAIDEGIAPSTSFSGASPQHITDPECATPSEEDPNVFEPWEVENFEGTQFGTVDLVTATTNSVNTVYAQLAAELGPDKIARTLDEMQFDRQDTSREREIPEVCSLALGVFDVTPLEMARAYAGFAARGILPDVNPILYVENDEGCIREYRPGKKKCEDEGKPEPDRFADANSVDVLNQTLTHVVSEGTATAADIGRPVAGKTGTTQNHANAWFAGYVPQLATVVWMGYPLQPGPDEKFGAECGRNIQNLDRKYEKQAECAEDDFIPLMESCADPELCRPVSGDLGYPIEVTGGSFPARIWAAFMTAAVAELEPVPFPEPTELPSGYVPSPETDSTYVPPATSEPEATTTTTLPPETEEPTPTEEPSIPPPATTTTTVPQSTPSPSPSGGNANANGNGNGNGNGNSDP